MAKLCDKCGTMLFGKLLQCDCVEWDAWFPERFHERGDGESVWARDAEHAARAACEKSDSRGDYDIARAGEVEVLVAQAEGDGTVFRFSVRAETVVEYSATALEEATS